MEEEDSWGDSTAEDMANEIMYSIRKAKASGVDVWLDGEYNVIFVDKGDEHYEVSPFEMKVYH